MDKISDLLKLEKHMGTQPHHHHISLLIAGKILLIIALIILIKPAFTGFMISRQLGEVNINASEIIAKQEKLNFQIGGLESKLESCNEEKKKLKEESDAEAKSVMDCLKEKSHVEVKMIIAKKDFETELSSNRKKLEEDKQKIMEEADKEKAKIGEIERNFNELALNSASNICCKARVDDKAIDSYKIAYNKVVCGKGEANPISC